MEPRIVPSIVAADYGEFRALIDDLPPEYGAWCEYRDRAMASRGEEVKAQPISPEQFRDRVRGNPVTIAELFRCARFLCKQHTSRPHRQREIQNIPRHGPPRKPPAEFASTRNDANGSVRSTEVPQSRDPTSV
jgi:hypothetical protein